MIFEHRSKNKKIIFVSILVFIFIGLTLLFWQNYTLKQGIEKNVYTNSWESIVRAIENCHVKSVFQKHSLEVSVILKNGRELKAIEPGIDSIIGVVMNSGVKCGRIQIATE